MALTAGLRAFIAHRDSWCCVRCGRYCPPGDRSIHHRTARGMGGDPTGALDRPANLILVCGSGTTGCHGRIESRRTESLAAGHLVPRGVDPATVPVQRWGRLVALTDEGWAETAEPPTAEPADVF